MPRMCGIGGATAPARNVKRSHSPTSKPAARSRRRCRGPDGSRRRAPARGRCDRATGARTGRTALGDHVLVEAQLAARPQDPPRLGERDGLVGHAAQDEREDDRVGLAVAERDRLGDAVTHLDPVGRRLDGRRAAGRRRARAPARAATADGYRSKFRPAPAPTSTTVPDRPATSRRRCARAPRASAIGAIRSHMRPNRLTAFPRSRAVGRARGRPAASCGRCRTPRAASWRGRHARRDSRRPR